MDAKALVKRVVVTLVFLAVIWCGYSLFQMWLESSLVGSAVCQLENGINPYAIQRYVAAGRIMPTVCWSVIAAGMGIIWIPAIFKLFRKGE